MLKKNKVLKKFVYNKLAFIHVIFWMFKKKLRFTDFCAQVHFFKNTALIIDVKISYLFYTEVFKS